MKHRKWLCPLAAVVLMLCMSFVALADGGLILDEAGLFDEATRAALESQAQSAALGHDCGVYLLTVNDTAGQSAREYAKDYYTAHGLGSGQGSSGILFLVAAGSRDYVTITYGQGVIAFTDETIGWMEDEIVPYLSQEDWMGAAQLYIELCTETLDDPAYWADRVVEAEPSGTAEQSGSGRIVLGAVLILGVPSAVAGIVCAILCGRMKTARPKQHADDYVAELTLTEQWDAFAYTDEVRNFDPPPEPPENVSTVDGDGFGGSQGGKF